MLVSQNSKMVQQEAAFMVQQWKKEKCSKLLHYGGK
ncbi:hypothetical protein SLEP1_g9225 [Rubroshorea leprosula]|uniref:Uncharacterized protein n=1 Tax=Rubroshorea leprosula TaxID=152421 RepID=A0AAV5IC73_9ROSI|nr:hypothetical protein SLEP1_g9225 [Rubroshorea leprosula]